MKTETKCTLLPANMGEKVIKIELAAARNEVERSLLFVTPNGFVNEHSHQKSADSKVHNSNPELYIDLTDYALHGADQMRYQPEVAGVGSPTGRMSHGIKPTKYPRVILSVKKSEYEFDNWRDLKNLKLADYLNKLDVRFELDQNEGIFFVNSYGKDQFTGEDRVTTVSIDLVKNNVCYLSREKLATHDSLWEETSLQALENTRNQQQNLVK